MEPRVDISAATNEEAEDSEEEVAFATKSLTPSFQPGSSNDEFKQEKGKSKRSPIVIT